jgi:RNA polymerase II subunit A small phosphatase-like protein
MSDPSNASNSPAAMRDNAATSSKRKRRGGDGASDKTGTRPRKSGGIGRLFTVFLCCRSSATADDDAVPASRLANNQKRESDAARVPTPPIAKEQPVAKAPQKDVGVVGGPQESESEKISEKPKEEVVAGAPGVTPAKVSVAPSGSEKAAEMVTASDGKVGEKSPETPTPTSMSPAPISVAIQSPTPTVSRSDNMAAVPEAPFPPRTAQSEETDMSDTDTIDDVTGEPSSSKEAAAHIPLPPASAAEKEDEEMVATSNDDEAEEHGHHDGALVASPGKERQQWLLPPLRPEFEGRKCLVLDLDETLVHSSFKVGNFSIVT